ncbi:MAG: ribose-phosphate diphosphokinase [Polaromonas sp.]
MSIPPCLLYFDDEADAALRLADLAGLTPCVIDRHRFPDGELKLRLPPALTGSVVLLRTLAQPNEKLIELLLAARTARALGAWHLTLVAPYLAYMRQDIAFLPGEAVSQRIVGQFLASLFDAVITVDPHLHRIAALEQAVPVRQAIVLSGAPLLGDWIAQRRPHPFLIGPDGESAQWVAQAAARHGLDHAVCQKLRHGDKHVDIELPSVNVQGRAVVLLDDVASSGRTVARAAQLLRAAGAASVDVAVTHALFAGDALQVIRDAGVAEVWSTDCIAHPSNVVSMAPAIAQTLHGLSD